MIREKRDEELGRQPLLADYGGWDSYREAVSYIMHCNTCQSCLQLSFDL